MDLSGLFNPKVIVDKRMAAAGEGNPQVPPQQMPPPAQPGQPPVGFTKPFSPEERQMQMQQLAQLLMARQQQGPQQPPPPQGPPRLPPFLQGQ